MSIALFLVKLVGAIQLSKTLYSSQNDLPPLNLGRTLALLKLLSFSTDTTRKRIHTFMLLIKHFEKLSVVVLLMIKFYYRLLLYIYI